MAAFQFPDPAVQTTVKNPITGSTYQWQDPPGKWVVTVSIREVGAIIWEGDNPPNPIGDYKLWYSTDTLELYFYYCDANGVCAWLPTSVPIQVLEELNTFAAQAEVDIDQLQYKQQLLQNALDQIYLDQQTGVSARSPIFSETEPSVHPDFTAPDNALVTGDKWYDTTDVEQLIEYVYDGTQWILTGNYVKKKGGDTMEGQLIINGPRKAGDDVDNPKLVSSVKVLSIDNAQNSSLQLRHSGNAKVYVGDNDISIASDIKFNRAAGTVVKTNVQDLLNIGSEEIAYLGRSIEDEDLITKKYVDDAKDFLQNEIIELEEEIEAIAPSTERGTWAYNPVGNVSIPGAYTMYTDTRDNGLGNVASIFAAVKNIALNEKDLSNVVHNFGGTDQGDLIEIFEEGDADYGLYSIISIEKLSNPNPGGISYTYISIDVDLERTGNGHTADSRARFKVFKAPSGGDASGFVLKTGDKMTGDLAIDTSEKSDDNEAGLTLKGSRPSVTNSSATITFENEQSTEKGYITYRSDDGYAYFGFNQDLFLNHQALFSVNSITMWPNSGIGATSNTPLVTFHNRSSGNEGDGLLKVTRPADSNRRGFVIRGNDALGVEQDMLYTYTNATGTPDAVNYVGKMDNDKNLVNKEYVDSKAGGVDISCTTSGRSKGDMWYCSSDQVLYIKVS